LSKPLAVFTPILGRWAHDFVKAHIDLILPGGTVVVAVSEVRQSALRWEVTAPTLSVAADLDPGHPSNSTEANVYDGLPTQAIDRFFSKDHIKRVERFLHEHGVESVLAQWMHPSLPLVAVSRELGLRYLCQAHGTDITAALKDPAVREAYHGYNYTEGIVAPSEFGRRQIVGLGVDPGKAHCLRHPVAIHGEPAERATEPVRCLVVGRMEPMKSPLLIIEAFKRASELFPDLRMDYSGDGSLRPAVEQAVLEGGLSASVKLHGYLPNHQVRSLMRRNHIFLHPSQVADGPRYDTCPVAVAEAMAEGMAIVATRHGGIPEEIANEETGLLVDEGDTQAVAAGITRLAADPGLRTRLGEAARERAKELFSPSAVRGQWLSLLGLRERPGNDRMP
jgi:glycosyltransferase involved in cell wall biosynthesis